MAVSRLLKSCAMPPVKLADRLHLLRLTQGRLGALALGDLRQQPLVRGFELARPFSHQALQALGGRAPGRADGPEPHIGAAGRATRPERR